MDRTRLPINSSEEKNQTLQSDSAASHAIAEAVTGLAGPFLIIAQNSLSAEKIFSELKFFLKKSENVVYLPDWETLIYDSFSPHDDIISNRLEVLNKIQENPYLLLVAPCQTLMHKLPPPSFVFGSSLLIETEQEINIGELRQNLKTKVYREVKTVVAHGEYAIRGSIIDIFPMGSETPYRVDLFDNIVDSIRTFDPETQRSLVKKNKISMFPAKEFPFTKTDINYFKNQWHIHFGGEPKHCPVYRDVSNGIPPAGIEYYLKFFFEQTATIFDYLPNETMIFSESIEEQVKEFWRNAETRYQSLRFDIRRPILPKKDIILDPDDFFGCMRSRSFSNFEAIKKKNSIVNSYMELPDEFRNRKRTSPIMPLIKLSEASKKKLLIVAETDGRRELIDETLRKEGVKAETVKNWGSFVQSDARIAITAASMQRGFASKLFDVITERELFGEEIFLARKKKRTVDNFAELIVKNLNELKLDDAVVHVDHGVGRYKGLQILDIEGRDTEFLVISYEDDAKLYVPVSSLELISRYSGLEGTAPPLHRLGGDVWTKAKKKAAIQVRDVAAELLDIYSRRGAAKGFSHQRPGEEYEQFVQRFPFQETPDQEKAISNVLRDMMSTQPMDRLICGDVGFGKTEVAMRAAFIAINSGKQVVALVPTTLLARQHEETFRDRFAETAANIESISRFKTKSEQHQILKSLAQGNLDIVIGTHSLLKENINFCDLGLLIIDEEHRFGVRQKEKLKSLRSGVDILTMTATPIPRTLNMAISGLRDLSIIATPPERRLSIKTFVHEKSEHLVKEAIQRELLRGGQVFYLQNQVHSIEKTAEQLRKGIPEATISIAHGQMREQQLEQVMLNFHRKNSNVLVCTTIIETGLDISNANTIIIERADKFGLAQIHQLRGRVGRSHHQAYAYLLVPPEDSLTSSAQKRLEAISESEDLGAGFVLASHDLEIRGAGEILGDGQSGNIQSIGYSMFSELLDKAVNDIRSGKIPTLEDFRKKAIEVNLNVPALIPENYLPDAHMRLILYKRIASTSTAEETKELQVEMIDRFGLFPNEVKNLFYITLLKLKAKNLGIEKLTAKESGLKIRFEENPSVKPESIIKLMEENPSRYSFNRGNEILVNVSMTTADDKFASIEELLSKLD